MWLALPGGFVSIVQHKDNPHMLIVRARAESDLNYFLSLVPTGREERVPQVFENAGTDYRFRAFVSRTRVMRAVATFIATDLDYTNFKNKAHEIDASRAEIFSRVWATIFDGYRARELDQLEAARQVRVEPYQPRFHTSGKRKRRRTG